MEYFFKGIVRVKDGIVEDGVEIDARVLSKEKVDKIYDIIMGD